jgi:type I restriction enzyme S subunit
MSNKVDATKMNEATKRELKPKLRFPEFRSAPEWEERLMGKLFSDRQETGFSSLPLLSLTDKEGVIPQEDSNRKINSSPDKSKYLRVCPGDIVYNTMRMWEGRSALVGLKGVVSPAYTVCKPNDLIDGAFFSYYFKSLQLIKQFRRYSQGLVNDTLNLKFSAFSEIFVPTPSLSEQQKITDCLSSIEALIATQTQKLDRLKSHKKGLMQHLFPAEGESMPRMRFPEFQGDYRWVQLFGHKLFKQISNKQHASNLPVLAITQEYGAIPRHTIGYTVSVTEKSIESYKVVEVGDFIISLRSFQGGIEYSNYRGICSPAYVVLRRKTDTSDIYFKYLFKTQRFIGELNKNIEGLRDGKMVSYKQFSELLLPVPSIKEQKKIADCLSSIDALIAAQTQKLDMLKSHKKGLMQHLFPAEGESMPRMRFPEFRDALEWEVKQLKSVCHMQAGKFVSASDIFEEYQDSLYQCYGGNGLRGYTRTYTHSGKYPLIGRQGALCGNVNFCIGKFHATEHALVATPKESIDVDWLFYALSLLNLNRYATGQAQPGLSVEVLEKIFIAVPKKEKEQQKIARCLSSNDELIAVQSKKLDTLKAHKKGLMQQLFPSLEEARG